MQRHSFDVVSFLFGAFFVGAALSAVLFDDTFGSFDGRWVWPIVLIIAGAGVLAATLRRGPSRGGGASPSDGPASDGPASDGPASDGPASDGPASDGNHA